MTEDNRPDPLRLLRQLKKEEKLKEQSEAGKLKIFLGFAAGVGKTYAMLEAARALKDQGVDVVAGYIEPHARPETIAMKAGLEELPSMAVEYRGIRQKEFDLDAGLARRPQLILVDELAHTNAAGCRHQKRYQDIEELLNAGINVFTTVNIQHLESLNDLVAGITGIMVRERIPDSVFDKASQVEVVDIEPEELIERLRDGKIYKAGQAERAMEHFFTREKLTALREIALRRMADRVNLIAEEERPASEREYYVGEHILTCISPSPTNAKVIRTAARLAHAFHGQFTALYVETPAVRNFDSKTKKMLEDNFRLARDLGAKIATVHGEDIPFQIAEYAKVSNASKIVIGRTNHKNRMGRPKGTLVERLTQCAPKLDVYIIPDIQPTFKKKAPHITKEVVTADDVAKTVGILAVSTAVGVLFKIAALPESNIIMIYLLGVLLCSIYTSGRICSLISSILSVLLFNFFFTVPFYSFKAYGKSYPVTFAVMMSVAFITSSMTAKLRRQGRESAKTAYRTELLLDNSRRLRRVKSGEEVAKEIAGQALKLLNLPVIIYLARGSGLREPFLFPRKGMTTAEMEIYTDTTERTTALWVFKNHHRAGACTATLPGAKAVYLPVQSNERTFAVVGVVLEERREIAPFEYGLLSAMLDEAALVLERFSREFY